MRSATRLTAGLTCSGSYCACDPTLPCGAQAVVKDYVAEQLQILLEKNILPLVEFNTPYTRRLLSNFASLTLGAFTRYILRHSLP